MTTRRATIAGTGFHVPERVVTNHDLEKLMDTTDRARTRSTGIDRGSWSGATPPETRRRRTWPCAQPSRP